MGASKKKVKKTPPYMKEKKADVLQKLYIFFQGAFKMLTFFLYIIPPKKYLT